MTGMARELAAAWLDVTISEVDVALGVEIPEEPARKWEEAAEHEARSRATASTVARLRRETVQALKESGLTQADVGRALGLSPQRISQLAAG